MRKFNSLLIVNVVCLIIVTFSFILIQAKKKYIPGVVVGYELFKGGRVPIVSDGKGGTVRWVVDIPWDRFTIQEKMSMAIKYNNPLNITDINEIIKVYGVKKIYIDEEKGGD